MTTQKVTPQATFSLAKFLHYLHFGKQYAEDVIISEKLTGGAKNKIQGYTSRIDWILKDLYTSMPLDSRTLLKQEIEGRDIAAIDSILNMVIVLDEEQRMELETYLENLLKKHNETDQRNRQQNGKEAA